MTTATCARIVDVTLTHATIAGRQVAWDVLVSAAQQDRVSTERDLRGMPLAPNGESDLAEAYREILRAALPEIRRAAKSAYDDYCQHGVIVDGRTAGGHGSMIAGPDGERQATYQAWDRLVKRIESAV